jgi:hypothetical protein
MKALAGMGVWACLVWAGYTYWPVVAEWVGKTIAYLQFHGWLF